jgi:hypothetical protein
MECTKFEGIFLLLGSLFCALRTQVNMILISKVKYMLFIKTLLLIIVNGVVIDD